MLKSDALRCATHQPTVIYNYSSFPVLQGSFSSILGTPLPSMLKMFPHFNTPECNKWLIRRLGEKMTGTFRFIRNRCDGAGNTSNMQVTGSCCPGLRNSTHRFELFPFFNTLSSNSASLLKPCFHILQKPVNELHPPLWAR